MGKKNKSNSDLGRSLIRDRFGNSRGKKFVANKSMLHTTEIQDGYEWGRLNLQSVTEEVSFQEFLSTAELAGTEFQAEKLNIKFINHRSNVGLLTENEKLKATDAHRKNEHLIKIPKRPKWTSETTLEELEQNERVSFLEWRRSLAQLQEEEGLLLTPFEKNLEFWRQLWRVVERSDVIAQIVDARNPMAYRCEDLEKYVKEVSENKCNLILINKADFLTPVQRQYWADYFTSIDVYVVFFSALLVSENMELCASDTEEKATKKSALQQEEEDEGDQLFCELKECVEDLEKAVEENEQQLSVLTSKIEEMLHPDASSIEKVVSNSSEILSRKGLIEFLRKFHKKPKVTENLTTIGLVGYPNVGKSSTINALLSTKKVSVSATPGKTKHFQTLYLDKDILLCDCPGLVMPSFVYTKAEMIINGILPIDQMRDHVPPINLISSLIPRHIMEDKYGFLLPLPIEDEDPDRSPTAEEVLNTYGYNRGFMTANGQPDNPRSARYILKDFVNGKLLYCTAPPGMDQSMYHTWPERRKIIDTNGTLPSQQKRTIKPNRTTTEDIDKGFFQSQSLGVHSKGTNPYMSSASQESGQLEKPWKKVNKHKNRKKHEKLRRIYAHLDKH